MSDVMADAHARQPFPMSRWVFGIAVFLGLLGYSIFGPLFMRSAPMLAGYSVKIMTENGHGSGVHIGRGYVITAAHVAEGATASNPIRVKTDSGQTQDASVLWINKEYDVALLRVADPSKISTAALSCESVHKGDAIRADGNPLDVEFVSTWGRVSGIERKNSSWAEIIITDLTIVQGMSGGPVLDRFNRIVGISVGAMAPTINNSQSMVGVSYIVPSTTICMLMAREAA